MISTGYPGDADPRDDEPEPDICEFCNEFMEFEDHVDYDPEIGRVVYCGGGSWNCVNKNCSSKKEHKTRIT